ncbi:MAG: arginine--tRNA ligase [Aureliella sp.]
MQLSKILQDRFFAALDGWIEDASDFSQRIAVARDPRHGDYQANIAMPLAKVLGKKPQEIAAELLERLDLTDYCEAPEIAGPGFINLRFKDTFLSQQLQQVAANERAAVGQIEDPKTYVIDYSSPNVAKPMHVGHIRTTVIGDALARVLRFLGHQVISDNHLGDWGTQFGMIIYGYKNFRDDAAFETQPVAELSRLYRIVQAVIGYQGAKPKLTDAEAKLAAAKANVEKCEASPDPDVKKQKKAVKAAERAVRSATDHLAGLKSKIDAVESNADLLAIAEQHEQIETRAQKETAKLHEGDAENLELWKKFLPISITEIEAVYQRLDVEFDHTLGESFYHPMLEQVVEGMIASGMAKEDNGAICVFLDGFDAPMIIRKRDGAFLYSTTDLATIEYRMEHFRPDAILYVVDHRQGEHFDKLFVAAREMGYDQVELQHVSFGTVLGPDGRPFKTRSGTVLGLEHLLDEAVDKAYEVVCNPERIDKAGLELSEEERRHIANTVGIGAIKYADLSHNRTSDYKFDINEMVQLEGDTAAYIQYMYARTRAILRKSGEDVNEATIDQFSISIEEPAERALALQLIQFEDALHQMVAEYYPSVLAGYLFSLAKQYASFFDQCHVLRAPTEELKRSRLAICYTVSRVLERGLGLLGIGVVERM